MLYIYVLEIALFLSVIPRKEEGKWQKEREVCSSPGAKYIVKKSTSNSVSGTCDQTVAYLARDVKLRNILVCKMFTGQANYVKTMCSHSLTITFLGIFVLVAVEALYQVETMLFTALLCACRA